MTHRTFNIVVFALTFLVLTTAKLAQTGHLQSGTSYTKQDAEAYAASRHGPDGATFLDPYFLKHIDNMNTKVVLDAGCGAAPWAIYAAQKGARVSGIDLQAYMIEQAHKAVAQAGVKDKVTLVVGDVADLPYSDYAFDHAMSINVGCNLPQIAPHMEELSRTLKRNGSAIVTGPTSFGVLFTNGQRTDAEVLKDIEAALANIGESTDAQVISNNLNRLSDVNRATFAFRNKKLVLVQDPGMLVAGEPIWRKLPNATVPNFYHDESEYLSAFKNAGFKTVSADHPSFADEEQRLKHNQGRNAKEQLGKAYVGNPAFFIFVAHK